MLWLAYEACLLQVMVQLAHIILTAVTRRRHNNPISLTFLSCLPTFLLTYFLPYQLCSLPTYLGSLRLERSFRGLDKILGEFR